MKFRGLSILIVLLLLLAACQSAQNAEENATEGEVSEGAPVIISEERSYPIEEIEMAVDNAAYPITEEDLQLLLQTWVLTYYTEDGVEKEPATKSLTFNADGRYELTSATSTWGGDWAVELFAVGSTLILNPGTETAEEFEIVEISTDLFTIRSVQNGVEIVEQFSPAN